MSTSALVFGGAGGIGSAVSRRLAGRHPIALTYFGHQDRAEELVAELRLGGAAAEAMRADASREKDVESAFEAAEALAPLHTVVFCVGGWDFPRLTEVTQASAEASISLNLVSAVLVLAEAARRVVDGGRVVLISSAAAALAPARHVTYAAAKAGLEAAARVAAKELGRRGVTVNVVSPGAVDTETLHHSTAPKAVEAMSRANAMQRLGTPDDIADAVMLLCDDRAAWVTGTILDASGGIR